MLFQLTPPIQRATAIVSSELNSLAISTHAPYTEGDRNNNFFITTNNRFQLTPPIQRATGLSMQRVIFEIFQLTPPIQRATALTLELKQF